MSEGIIKKVKGDDAERRLTEQRQRLANDRARETGKQRYQQVITITGSFLSVTILSTFSFTHHLRCFQCTRRTTCACAFSFTISYARLLSKITPSNLESIAATDFNFGVIIVMSSSQGIPCRAHFRFGRGECASRCSKITVSCLTLEAHCLV